MILAWQQGDTCYIPSVLFGEPPPDEVDWKLATFLQCYVNDPLRWRAIAFLLGQEGWRTAAELAEALEIPAYQIVERLSGLAGTRLVEEQILLTGPIYRLTDDRELRRSAGRLCAGREL